MTELFPIFPNSCCSKTPHILFRRKSEYLIRLPTPSIESSHDHSSAVNANKDCSCPEPRSFHTLISSRGSSHEATPGDEYLLLLGGLNEIGPLKSFHLYSYDENTWKSLPSFPTCIYGHTCLHLHGKSILEKNWNKFKQPKQSPSNLSSNLSLCDEILVFGGMIGNGKLTNAMWIFRENVWMQLKSSQSLPLPANTNHVMPSPCIYHSMVYNEKKNSLVSFGGITVGGPSNEMWSFNISTLTWKKYTWNPEAGPSPRYRQSMVTWKKFILLIGGLAHNTTYQDVWIFDLEIEQWLPYSVTFPGAVKGLESVELLSVIFCNELLVWRGDTLFRIPLRMFEFASKSSLIHFQVVDGLPSRNNAMVPMACMGSSMTCLMDSIYIMAGENNIGYFSTLYTLPLSNLQSASGRSVNLRKQKQFPLVSLGRFPNLSLTGNFDEDVKNIPQQLSLLSRTLSFDLWSSLRELRTNTHQYRLHSVIHAGIQCRNHPVGILAPDEEAYITFRLLFNPIIFEIHKIDVRSKLHNFTIEKVELPQLDSNFVERIRISARRNLQSIPFSSQIEKFQRRRVFKVISDEIILAARKSNIWEGVLFPLHTLSDTHKHFLFSKGLCFDTTDPYLIAGRVFSDWPDARGIFVNQNCNLYAWINYEEAIQIISYQSNGDIQACYHRLCDALLSLELKCAKDKYRGYLTLDPKHIGTTLSIEVDLNLNSFGYHSENHSALHSVFPSAFPSELHSKLNQWKKDNEDILVIRHNVDTSYTVRSCVTLGLSMGQIAYQFSKALESMLRILKHSTTPMTNNTDRNIHSHINIREYIQGNRLGDDQVNIEKFSNTIEKQLIQIHEFKSNQLKIMHNDDTETLVDNFKNDQVDKANITDVAKRDITNVTNITDTIITNATDITNAIGIANISSNQDNLSQQFITTDLVDQNQIKVILKENAEITCQTEKSMITIASSPSMEEKSVANEKLDAFEEPMTNEDFGAAKKLKVDEKPIAAENFLPSENPVVVEKFVTSTPFASNSKMITSSNSLFEIPVMNSSTKNGMTSHDLIALYLCACHKHHTTPNSLILQRIKSNTLSLNGVLDMKNNVVGDQGCKPLIELIPYLPNVKSINLCHNGIENSGVEFLCQTLILEEQLWIEEINLSRNSISLQGAVALLQFLKQNHSIRRIQLEDTLISPKFLNALQNVLKCR